ncbi:hypothetical protein MKZ08_16440 [Viridibacillus sp. FSL R5-0477]|uniref:Uncharacterized protein n=1 Tax=Viridibacillus arenosi FSL R5-213 TaxID=1227360 RepID=W4F0V1_9BACL|nr:hypothetical protein [Viridibacillus arenosi]ETT85952.1 hypothetical protein C176_10987 [Viridibacillus arenosi FSL R5-213]OMC93350.1 hypothetical protein BK137_02210 [Viridibacillus arenosi]
MGRNVKLLYCILGSAVLALLNSPILGYAKLGMFPGGYGGHVIGHLLVLIADILSLVGFLLLIIFSFILIINNINLKKN